MLTNQFIVVGILIHFPNIYINGKKERIEEMKKFLSVFIMILIHMVGYSAIMLKVSIIQK